MRGTARKSLRSAWQSTLALHASPNKITDARATFLRCPVISRILERLGGLRSLTPVLPKQDNASMIAISRPKDWESIRFSRGLRRDRPTRTKACARKKRPVRAVGVDCFPAGELLSCNLGCSLHGAQHERILAHGLNHVRPASHSSEESDREGHE